MLLSILIATLENRKEQFIKLHNFIKYQIDANNLQEEVEILFFEDDKTYPVGYKRNILLQNADGKYVCFVDDDDWISDDYVISIVTALKDNPDIDCVGIKGKLISYIEEINKEFIHSIKYSDYLEDNEFYYRPPNHLNPIKKEIAEKFKFPIVNFGEDADWAMRICKSGYIKTEVFIDKVLYSYFFDPKKSETMKRI